MHVDIGDIRANAEHVVVQGTGPTRPNRRRKPLRNHLLICNKKDPVKINMSAALDYLRSYPETLASNSGAITLSFHNTHYRTGYCDAE